MAPLSVPAKLAVSFTLQRRRQNGRMAKSSGENGEVFGKNGKPGGEMAKPNASFYLLKCRCVIFPLVLKEVDHDWQCVIFLGGQKCLKIGIGPSFGWFQGNNKETTYPISKRKNETIVSCANPCLAPSESWHRRNSPHAPQTAHNRTQVIVSSLKACKQS